jgi:glycosyltransferase involved in cell wall biosynthesis
VTSDNLKAQNPEIEALRDGENGFLYRSGDVLDLSKKILTILNDGVLRKRLGQEARRTALEDYPVEAMVDGLKTAFFTAVDRHRNGRG